MYTIDFLENAIGSEFTPALRFAVLEQFTSPVSLRSTVSSLRRLILIDPERFEELLLRHIGAHKYWMQFSICSIHSLYWFYRGIYEKIFFDYYSGPTTYASSAYFEAISSIPMRNLGGKNLIIRRSYLPDRGEPRIRFAATPCNPDQEVRNIEFLYDRYSMSWKRTEPLLTIGTWYMQDFVDPTDQSRFDLKANNPKEYGEIQDKLVQRIEFFQVHLGLPVDFLRDLDLKYEEAA